MSEQRTMAEQARVILEPIWKERGLLDPPTRNSSDMIIEPTPEGRKRSIWWCEQHDCSAFQPRQCVYANFVDPYRPCRIVAGVFVEVNE